MDARRLPAMQHAPQVLFSSRDPPLEIRNVAGLKRSDDVGYVTFGQYLSITNQIMSKALQYSSLGTSRHLTVWRQLFLRSSSSAIIFIITSNAPRPICTVE